jgi:hypothetical protein
LFMAAGCKLTQIDCYSSYQSSQPIDSSPSTQAD